MFEFDKMKSLAKEQKHGLNFEEAQALWQRPSIMLRSQYPEEERWLLIAEYKNVYWAAIFTYREDNIRIISVRKARDNEKKYFAQQKIK